MPLPAPQTHCRVAAKHSRYAARRVEVALSKALPRSLRPLQRVSRRLLHRPAHRSRKQPGHQIAIGGSPTTPRGFLPWRLSDASPQCQLIDREWAGIRNPSQKIQSAATGPSASGVWRKLAIRFAAPCPPSPTLIQEYGRSVFPRDLREKMREIYHTGGRFFLYSFP